MTENFLAKLRNTRLTTKGFPILIISHSSLDTISSGTGDLASVGMPFHNESMRQSIEKGIKNSQMSKFDIVLLTEEMRLKQQDRFSDKSSLYEYQDILNVLGKGQVEENDYHKFSLLVDPDGINLEDTNKIKNRLADNRERFDKISRAYKHGNIRDSLEKDYDSTLVQDIINKKKQNLPWYEDLSLSTVLSSHERLRRKVDNPLIITNDEIYIYSGTRLEYSFVINENAFIRDDGSSKAKQRLKNILIYDPDGHNEITIDVGTNIYINQRNIEWDNANVSTSAREVKIVLNPSGGCSFSLVKIKDEVNNISYSLKICVLGVPASYLDSIRTLYTLYVTKQRNRSKLQLQGLTGELVINPDNDNEIRESAINGETYSCQYDETLILDILPENINSDTGKLDCVLKCGIVEIPIQISDTPNKPDVLTGADALKKKYEIKKSLEFKADKILCGTEEFYTKEQFRRSLEKESLFVNNGWLCICETVDGYEEKRLNVPEEVKLAYWEMIKYLRANHTVPSLVYLSEEYKELAERYIASVENAISAVSVGQSLSTQVNDMLLLGCVIQESGEKIIEMSPLQPLNVLYQCNLSKEKGVSTVRDELVEKLTPLYLLPYIRNTNRELYHAIEQKHSPEWRFYAPFENKRYQGTRNFVQKLVCEKIADYVKFFPFLFEDIDNNLFYLNLVNMGDCREVLNGIIRFYIKELRTKNIDELICFNINIYSDTVIENDFSIMSDSKRLHAFIEREYSKDVEDINDLEQTLIKNIRCFYRNTSDSEYHYAHLTFYEMPIAEECGDSEIETFNTGISLDGIIAGLPSVYNSEWYKTGFGTKYASSNRMTELAAHYNSLFRVAFSGSAYQPHLSMFTEIKKGQEAQQGKIYDSSNWVVFVDPKVDLSFFQKRRINGNELMIIHYSDQYTSSNGYDDITVTQKSDQYNEIITEQLQKKGVNATANDINSIISLFNAINGSWMLRLITSKKLTGAADSNFSREKMSILSAIKLCMAYYSHSQIVWVPISLEEMLRVSSGAGYSQKEGLLSARNLGFETQARILLQQRMQKCLNFIIYHIIR